MMAKEKDKEKKSAKKKAAKTNSEEKVAPAPTPAPPPPAPEPTPAPPPPSAPPEFKQPFMTWAKISGLQSSAVGAQIRFGLQKKQTFTEKEFNSIIHNYKQGVVK